MNAIVVVLNWKNGVLNAKVAALNSNDDIPILKVATHNSKLGQICSKHGVLISVVEWVMPTLQIAYSFFDRECASQIN